MFIGLIFACFCFKTMIMSLTCSQSWFLIATSLERSQLKPLFPILDALPDELHNTVPYLLSFVMGMYHFFEPITRVPVIVNEFVPLSLDLSPCGAFAHSKIEILLFWCIC